MKKIMVGLFALLGSSLPVAAQLDPEVARAWELVRKAGKLEYKQPELALGLYDSATGVTQTRVAGYVGMVNCYLRMNDLVKATTAAEKLVAAGPMPEHLTVLGVLYDKTGRDTQATRCYLIAIDSLNNRIRHPESYLINSSYGTLEQKIEGNLIVNRINRSQLLILAGRREEGVKEEQEIRAAYPKHWALSLIAGDSRKSILKSWFRKS